MDEINYTNLIDDEIARLVTALKAQKPESNEYKAIHSELCSFMKIKHEEAQIRQAAYDAELNRKLQDEKMNHEASEAALNRGFEDEKLTRAEQLKQEEMTHEAAMKHKEMAHEAAMKQEEMKQIMFRGGIDVCKSLLSVASLLALAKATFDCEKVGRPTSLVWKMIPLPKLF